ITVIDGRRWWTWDGQSQAVTNEGEVTAEGRAGGVDRALVLMLAPAAVMSAILFHVAGQGSHAQRPALRVIGKPRNETQDVIWPGADEYELLVHDERGVLLRSVGYLDGAPYASIEFLDVAFDEQFPADTFTFLPPPHVRVRRVSGR